MIRSTAVGGLLTMFALAIGATSASAQVFGTYSWQMQPYCHVVTLTLTSVAGNFTLDGSEDQCGAAKKASADGIGVFNPDGTVGLNFTIVTPGGEAIQVAASVSPANGQGTWTDNAGNSGTFAFLTATPGLPARPARNVRFRVENLATTLSVPGLVTVNTWTATPVENVGGGVYNAAQGSYTLPSAGTYLVTTSVRWQAFAAATGYKCIYVTVNGSGQRATSCDLPSTTASFQLQTLSTVLTLPAGSALSIRAYQSTGGAATVGSSGGSEAFYTVTRLY